MDNMREKEQRIVSAHKKGGGVVSIDPGKKTGWAYFQNGLLIQCGVETNFSMKEFVLYHPFINVSLVRASALQNPPVVIEKPVVYPRDKVRPNDLITLAILVGEVKGVAESLGFEVELVTPRVWKGTVPKKIHNRRVLLELIPEELKLLPRRSRAKDYDHNMLDAIGLGLWKLGRTVR